MHTSVKDKNKRITFFLFVPKNFTIAKNDPYIMMKQTAYSGTNIYICSVTTLAFQISKINLVKPNNAVIYECMSATE